MHEYRIQQIDGVFIIQVKHKYTTGFWWWKKEHEVWMDATADGGVPGYVGPFPLPLCCHFTNVEVARRKVEQFKMQNIIKTNQIFLYQ